MKKATTSKSAKVVNSNDIVIKSKDNRKTSTIDKVAEASVKGITTAKALTIIKNANDVIENKTKDKAKGFYAIKINEKNFKEWFEKNQDKEEKINGVKYNQASNLANIWHYVWCDKVLNVYDSNKATSLVAYVKKDYAKVVSMHKNGTISETMLKDDIVKALKKEFGTECKTTKEGKSETKTSTINEDINIIEKIIEGYCEQLVKKGNCEKHYNDVRSAWDNILSELCK